MATVNANPHVNEPAKVEIEYPRLYQDDKTLRTFAYLADDCIAAQGPLPDLVLLVPDEIPPGLMMLQIAVHERFEFGSGYALAALPGLASSSARSVRDVRVAGTIADHVSADGRRQFTGGNSQGYWSKRGSSGSPVFLDHGQQLAGILSLSELGENRPHEAFIVSGTTIRPHVFRLATKRALQKQQLDHATLQPLIEALGELNVPIAEIPAAMKQLVDVTSAVQKRQLDYTALRPIIEALGTLDIPSAEIPGALNQLVEAARTRAANRVHPFGERSDIETAIFAAREKLRYLDLAGAREALQAKIKEEEEALQRRILPLLRERALIERLSFNHEAAKETQIKINSYIATKDVSAWVNYINLGDLLASQEDLDGALASYRSAITTAETLANRYPANTQWQRDLSVSHEKIGDVLVLQGDSDGALAVYREALAVPNHWRTAIRLIFNGRPTSGPTVTRSVMCTRREAISTLHLQPTMPALPSRDLCIVVMGRMKNGTAAFLLVTTGLETSSHCRQIAMVRSRRTAMPSPSLRHWPAETPRTGNGSWISQSAIARLGIFSARRAIGTARLPPTGRPSISSGR